MPLSFVNLQITLPASGNTDEAIELLIQSCHLCCDRASAAPTRPSGSVGVRDQFRNNADGSTTSRLFPDLSPAPTAPRLQRRSASLDQIASGWFLGAATGCGVPGGPTVCDTSPSGVRHIADRST